MCTEDRRRESELVCLTKQNDTKENFTHSSSLTNVKIRAT